MSIKEDMLVYYIQLLSITYWRVEHLGRASPWYPTMVYYLDLLIEKVRALGGDPYTVPPTPDGNVPGLHGPGKHGGRNHDEDEREVVIVNIFPRGKDHEK